MGLNERVKLAREKIGLTREELEKKAGIARGYVSRIERGKGGTRFGLGSNTLNKLALALNVRLDWLLNGGETMTDETEHDALPARTLALRLAREGGVSDVVLRLVESAQYEHANERTTWWWINVIKLQEAVHNHEKNTTGHERQTNPPVTQIRLRNSTHKVSSD